jgi:hypothetical protein
MRDLSLSVNFVDMDADEDPLELFRPRMTTPGERLE